MDIIGEDGFVQQYYPIITPTIEHHSETENHVDDAEVAQIASNTALLLTQQTKNTEFDGQFASNATILTTQESTNTDFDERINFNVESIAANEDSFDFAFGLNSQVWVKMEEGQQNTPGVVVTRDSDCKIEATQLVLQHTDGTGGNLTLYGDSNLFYTPLTGDGTDRSLTRGGDYRFGRDHLNTGDLSGKADGLYMSEFNNVVDITVSDDNPSILVHGMKQDAPYIEIRTTEPSDPASAVLFSVDIESTYCENLTVGPNTGPNTYDFRVDSDGNITESKNIDCINLSAENKIECEDLEIHNTSYVGVAALRIFDEFGTRVFSVSNEGKITSKYNEDHDINNAFGDGSIFVGSAKFGYKRSHHRPSIKRLIQNHIPKYLADLGITLTNLSNHTSFDIDQLTVKRWLKVAKNVTGDDKTTEDVFPNSNDSIDFEDVVFHQVQNELDSIETDVTQLQTDVTALQTASGLGENATIESTTQASLVIKSTNPNYIGTSATLNSVVFQVLLDRPDDANDYKVGLHNRESSIFWSMEKAGNDKLAWAQSQNNGQLVLFGNGQTSATMKGWVNNPGDSHLTMIGNTMFRGGLTLDTNAVFTPSSETDTGFNASTNGRGFTLDDDNLWVRTSSGDWKKSPLLAFGAVSGGGNDYEVHYDHNTASSNYGTNWIVLPDGYSTYTIKLGGDSGYSFLRNFNIQMPTWASTIKKITIHNLAAVLKLRLHTLNSGNGFWSWRDATQWRNSNAGNLGLKHENGLNISSTVEIHTSQHPNSTLYSYFNVVSGNVVEVAL